MKDEPHNRPIHPSSFPIHPLYFSWVGNATKQGGSRRDRWRCEINLRRRMSHTPFEVAVAG